MNFRSSSKGGPKYLYCRFCPAIRLAGFYLSDNDYETLTASCWVTKVFTSNVILAVVLDICI